jgi:hypothetical protein
MSSSYRVDDGAISLVTRTPGDHRFSIAVQSRADAPDGTLLPRAFTVFTWGEDGRLDAAEAYTDEYVETDGLALPASRLVVRADADGLLARRLVLRGHVVRAQARS